MVEVWKSGVLDPEVPKEDALKIRKCSCSHRDIVV